MSVWGSRPLLLRSHPPDWAQPLHLLQDHTHPSWPWELVLTLLASRGPPAAPSTPARSLFRILKRHLSHGLTGPWPLLGDRQSSCGHPVLPMGDTKGQRGPQPSGPTGPLTPGQHLWVSTDSVPPANSLVPAWWLWGYPAPPRPGRGAPDGPGGAQPLLGQGEGLLVALEVASTPPQDGERGSWWQRWGTGHRTGNPCPASPQTFYKTSCCPHTSSAGSLLCVIDEDFF